MTIKQIINRIAQLSALAAECVIEGARRAAAEFYNLVCLYEIQLERIVRA